MTIVKSAGPDYHREQVLAFLVGARVLEQVAGYPSSLPFAVELTGHCGMGSGSTQLVLLGPLWGEGWAGTHTVFSQASP